MKKPFLILIFTVCVFLLAACGPKLYSVNLSYSSALGNVQGADVQKLPKGEVISWNAIPNENIVFTGWYIDGLLYTTQNTLNYTIESSVDIEARFEYPSYTLTIQSIKFYAIYDNPNSSQMFELKVATLQLSLREVIDREIFPEIEWINLERDEETWIVVADEQSVLLHTFEPSQALIYEDFQGIDEASIIFRYAYLFHIQYSTGQHVSSSAAFGTEFTIRLEPKDTMTEVRVPLFSDSYASIYMDITYSFNINNTSDI